MPNGNSQGQNVFGEINIKLLGPPTLQLLPTFSLFLIHFAIWSSTLWLGTLYYTDKPKQPQTHYLTVLFSVSHLIECFHKHLIRNQEDTNAFPLLPHNWHMTDASMTHELFTQLDSIQVVEVFLLSSLPSADSFHKTVCLLLCSWQEH